MAVARFLKARVVVLAIVLLAGCTGHGGARLDAGTKLRSLDGMHHDLGWAVDLVGIGDGQFAFVNGVTRVGTDRRFTITIGKRGARSTRYENPWHEVLVSASAWWTGREVMVVGLRCNEASRSALESDIVNEVPPDQRCGTPSHEQAIGFDPGTHRWRVAARRLPGSGSDASAGSSYRTKAVYWYYDDAGLDRRLVLDTADGSTAPVPAPPRGFDGAYCLGQYGLLFIGGHDDLQAVIAGRQKRTTLAAFRMDGTRWHRLALPERDRLPPAIGVSACDPRGGFASNTADLQKTGLVPRWLHVAPNTLRWAPLPGPPPSEGTAFDTVGSMVDGIAYQDIGRQLVAYRRSNDSWSPFARLGGHPDHTVVSGGDAAYLTDQFSAGDVRLIP
jgi:hypothetical protein